MRILVEDDGGVGRRDEVAEAVRVARDAFAQAVGAVLVAAPPTEGRAGPDPEPAPPAEDWVAAITEDLLRTEVLLAQRVTAARRLGVEMRPHLEQYTRPPEQQPWPAPLQACCWAVLRGMRPEDTGLYSSWAQGAADAVVGADGPIVYGFPSVVEAEAFTLAAGLAVVDHRR